MSAQNSVTAEIPPLEQAAIVLLSMGEELAAAVLRCLSRDELLRVTQVMSRIGGVRVDAVRTSLQNFFHDYREQSGVHGASRSYLKRSLDLALGADVAESVLNSIYGNAIRPKMARLQWASPRWLAERIEREHVRMQTVFLAFLPPELAGAVVEALPEAVREQVLLNLAKLSEVDRDLLIELDELVDACLDSLGLQSASVEGVRQVAEILNRLPDKRGQMVERLRERDASVVADIERSMYDFSILARQTEETILRIVESTAPEQWAVALKGCEPELRAAILRAMPRRQAQTFTDMMRRMGPAPRSRVEQAREEIMSVVRELAEAREIEVQLYEEAVVE